MQKLFTRLKLFTLFSIICYSASSQKLFWSDVAGAGAQTGQQQKLLPKKYRAVSLDTAGILSFFKTAPKEFTVAAKSNPSILLLPMPDGSFQKFKLVETSIMEPGLAAQFPNIKTFGGQGIDDPYATLKLEWSPSGLHAMTFSPISASVVIDPQSEETSANYISYYKTDQERSQPFIENEPIVKPRKGNKKGIAPRTEAGQCIGGTLKKYRLAVACTGEYARAIKNSTVTKAEAFAAIVTTVNRVDGVYETELAIRLVLIDSNMKIVYTNPSTDAFTGNSDPFTLIDESQLVIDSLIGNANYDIGHTFSTGAGGLAGLGVVCEEGSKANGVTGMGNPVGDAYDIDYVAHEMGHQFGANHPFNATTGSCSGNGVKTTNAEPGSGSTIMAYAGICNTANDLQPHSDPQFHAVSLDEITAYSINSTGNSCAVQTVTGNAAPVVLAGNDYTIPKSTPFALTGSATDADGDALTYSWEQTDVGGAFGDWNKPTGNAPLFRSFAPVTTPVRYFPKMSDIINNTTTIGEILPSYARTMHFRLTARDNRAGGGGVCFDEAAVTVAATAGPFIITQPNTAVTWSAGEFRTITWNVTNTNIAPVNCTSVAIELSADGGKTFPYVLMATTPNDGQEEIIVPNNITNAARIRIRSIGNVFFDISNVNFTIQASTEQGFVFNNPAPVTTCSSTVPGTVISTSGLNGYSDLITLSASGNPAGSTVVFGGNPIIPGSSDSISLIGNIASGIYNVTITGTSGTVVKTRVIQFVIGTPADAPAGFSPANNSTGHVPNATFKWSAIRGAQSYNLQISATAAFTSTIQNLTNLTDTSYTLTVPLTDNTQYYWRVRGNNTCGFGPASPAFLFKTASIVCGDTVFSTNVPLAIDTIVSTITSTLNIPVGGIISDVNVVSLKGTHDYVGDLVVSLISPSNTVVKLFEQVCNTAARKNFDINFDDEAASATIPCPPTGGITRRPLQALSAFDNENSKGTWTLKIEDLEDEDGGSLNNWGLRICSYVSTALPVNWLTFTGQKNENNNSIVLQWTTAAELNNHYYEIERSADGINFSMIGKIDAGKEPGMQQQYVFNDAQPYTGSNYYRLKQVDIDGHFNYSKIVRIVLDKTGLRYVVYPNPATDKSTIRILAELKNVTIRLNDASGKAVYQKSISAVKTGEEIEIPVKRLSKGLYILSITSEQGISTEKVIVQ